jgi:hypothetical protein
MAEGCDPRMVFSQYYHQSALWSSPSASHRRALPALAGLPSYLIVTSSDTPPGHLPLFVRENTPVQPQYAGAIRSHLRLDFTIKPSGYQHWHQSRTSVRDSARKRGCPSANGCCWGLLAFSLSRRKIRWSVTPMCVGEDRRPTSTFAIEFPPSSYVADSNDTSRYMGTVYI